jgi:dTDP-4-amino-4,6-dideoxygalactose transaminase
MKSLGLGPGDEVITTASTFIATSEAITQTGAQVVFVDSNEKTYTIDPDQVARAVTPKTKAIVPVHLYGQPADIGAILEIAEQHQLYVIEDAAQAHGAMYRDRTIGTIGTIACFSFYPGKNLGAYGDAGAIVTQDEALADKVRMYANHGRIDKYNHEIEGVNSRLDGLQAAILNVKLKHVHTWTERRRAIAQQYDKALGDVVVTPYAAPDRKHVYHLYVVRVKNRDQVQARLTEKGVATGIHYPIPLPFLEAYAYLGYKAADFPVADRFKDEILSLPIHGSMTDEEVDYVINSVRSAVQA